MAAGSWVLRWSASVAAAPCNLRKPNHVERAVQSTQPRAPPREGLRHVPAGMSECACGGTVGRTGQAATATAALAQEGRRYGVERARGTAAVELDDFSSRSRALRYASGTDRAQTKRPAAWRPMTSTSGAANFVVSQAPTRVKNANPNPRCALPTSTWPTPGSRIAAARTRYELGCGARTDFVRFMGCAFTDEISR